MLGGMLLALALYFPGSHLIASAVNPALVEAQRATPGGGGRPTPPPARPSSIPTGTRALRQRLRHRQEPARRARHLVPRSARLPTMRPPIHVGSGALAVACGERLDDAELKALKTATGDQLKQQLARQRLSGRGRSGRDRLSGAVARIVRVRRRRDRALRPAGRRIGRDVPDPDPLHRDEPALSHRHRLGRRLPARHQLRDRRASPGISMPGCGMRSGSRRCRRW